MKPDDSTLIAYADGELDAAGAASVEQALAESSELRESVARLRASRLPYQDAFAAQKLPPLPDALRLRIEAMASAAQAQSAAAAAQAQPREQGQEQEPVPASAKVVPLPARRNRPMLWLAAAFVAGAFCAGLVQQFAAGGFGGGSGPSLAASGAKKPWISVAADYQQLYTRDTVANLTPDPAVSRRSSARSAATTASACACPTSAWPACASRPSTACATTASRWSRSSTCPSTACRSPCA
ncbi:anti-sigma factor family protein [Burkholderia gladioli]|uniref:anti-sigma factor family protein n=1 Tax=Burkholderia gladioli TaxID=28095 RepID=UPI001FC882C6|nr:hypothetical protein [Burkholderia gladioli]